MPDGSEGAIRPQTVEFVRESATGEFPSSPSLKSYSDNITGFTWSPDGGISGRRGLGSPDVATHFNGPESHEVTVSYDLQKFPVDSNGDPAGPSGDGLVRTADNQLPNTHGIRVREDNDSIPPEETVNGTTSKDTRLYLVGVGGYVSGVTFSGDPGSDQPVTVELTYQFEKVRLFQFDQPGSSVSFEVENKGTTSVDVKIEGDSTSAETVTVSGGSTATTTGTFSTLAAARLSDDIDGDVVIREGTGGDDLAVIRGEPFYNHGEGDLGVPAIDGGTQEGEIGTSYETILGDVIERPQDTAIAYEINSVEYAVENDLDTREQVESPRMSMDAGNRTVEVTTTIVGATESVESAEQHLGAQNNNLLWYLDGGLLQADSAALTDFSGVDKTQGEAAMSLDNTFEGQGVTVTEGASP